MQSPGLLYLLPCPIAEDSAAQVLPAQVLSTIPGLQHFYVEDARTARRFIRAVSADYVLESASMEVIAKHGHTDLQPLKRWLGAGLSVGVLSEAGCPAIADPGAELVAVAHEMGAVVKPLVGPSSILLTLMASGLNGQRFAFEGYLPVKEPERGKRIKALEERSRLEQSTQLFIETPYRNNALLTDLLRHCAPATRICIGMGLTGPDEWVKTQTAAAWKRNLPSLGKVPAVFAMLA